MAAEKKENQGAEQNNEVRIDNDPDRKINFSKVNKNPWMIASLVLGIISVILLVLFLTNGTSGGMSEKKAVNKSLELIKNAYNVDLEFVSSEKDGDVYLINTNFEDSPLELQVTTDYKFLKLPGGWVRVSDIEELADLNSGESAQTDIPKTDKPEVELFVMAFCPYGVQAEQAMKPVYDLLKDKADFKIRYIVNIDGNTLADVDSLHGELEAQEDARQVCVAKYYPDKLWDYVMEIDSTCYATYTKDLATCWKKAAAKFGIDTAKIDTCSKNEAVALLKFDETNANENSVSGSPTLLINGVKYTGGRTSDAYKTGICSAFEDAPDECEEELSSETTTASGSC